MVTYLNQQLVGFSRVYEASGFGGETVLFSVLRSAWFCCGLIIKERKELLIFRRESGLCCHAVSSREASCAFVNKQIRGGGNRSRGGLRIAGIEKCGSGKGWLHWITWRSSFQ